MRKAQLQEKPAKSLSCPGHGKSCSESASSTNVKKDNPASPHSFFNQFLQYEKSEFSSRKDGEKYSYKAPSARTVAVEMEGLSSLAANSLAIGMKIT